jgi:hypothetical protein
MIFLHRMVSEYHFKYNYNCYVTEIVLPLFKICPLTMGFDLKIMQNIAPVFYPKQWKGFLIRFGV